MAGPDALKRARVRERAVRLLEQFFTGDREEGRRTVFNLAFGDCERDPRGNIDFPGPVIEFADQAVEQLLAFGCSDRGRHSLSLLLRKMSEVRGRQTEPDYFDLPPLLDGLCALPTREEELAYLGRLLAEIRARARTYSALRAVGEIGAQPSDPGRDDEITDEADIALLRLERRERRTSRDYEDLLKAFGEVRRVALLGAPGAGKSTSLRRLASDLAQKALTDPAAPLPLFVTLGDWRGDEAIADFIAAHCPEIGWAMQGLAESGRLVLLLDGLNEVPTAKCGEKAKSVLALIGRLVPKRSGGEPPSVGAQPANGRVIVSCRRDDYTGDLDLGLDTLTLQPLSPQRVRAVLHQWTADRGEPSERAEQLFWQLAGDQRLASVLATWIEAGSTEDAFWSLSTPSDDKAAYAKTSGEEDAIWRRCVPNPRSLLRLAENPFMLNMVYQVWRAEGALPRNRGDLFARFIDRLLARERLFVKSAETRYWNRTAEGEGLLRGLSETAWRMQGERVGRDRAEAEDFGVLTVLGREDALAALGSEASLKKAEDATLLEGGEEIRFRHQLLQEYFTASAMRRHIEATPPLAAAKLWPPDHWWERSGWEESAVLLAGLFSDDCAPVIRWLKDVQPEVAAQSILESGAALADRSALLRELHDAWLPRLTDIEREPAPEARAAIGRALGRLGLDDRRGVGLTAEGLPDIDWVEIPGDEFIYQDGERRRIEPLRISRYPVTNAQFQAFLDAEDGYRDGRWWEGLDDPDRSPAPPQWDIPNHPRETVSWFEAMAFCGWLSHRIGLAIRLPTEWEWERAARGTDGRAYPWGRDYRAGHANIDETSGDAGPHNLGRTSAVGIYPQGASREGVLDLSGNVWEWCLNEWDDPERTQRGGRGSRVVRGGSWSFGQDGARAGARGGDPPYGPRRRPRVSCGVRLPHPLWSLNRA